MNTIADPSKGARGVAVLGIVAALLFIGGTLLVYRLLIQAPMELARATADGVRSLFHLTPRVSINETVVIEENTPILEVATVSRSVWVQHQWTHTWLGSTKEFHVEGTFTARAGFDLREPFDIRITSSPLHVTARLPEPRLLSLQMDTFRVTRDESGWWNHLTEDDRTNAVATLQTSARTKAEHSGILEEVRRSARERIRDLVERNGAIVRFDDPAQ